MYKKAVRTKTGFKVIHINRRRACRLMCLECVGWEQAEVDRCSGKMMDGSVCSLIPFKNMTGKQNAKVRDEAVRKFCLECMGGNRMEVANCKSFYCPLYPFRSSMTDKLTLFDMKVPDEVILNWLENAIYTGVHDLTKEFRGKPIG